MQQLSFNFFEPKNEDELYVFIRELKCKNVSDAIDYFGYPVAFRQAFKKWRMSRK